MSLLEVTGLQPIDVVFFDLVGTLIHARTSIGEQYAACARRFGATAAEPALLGRAFTQAMRQAPAMAFPGRSYAETAEAERGWWRQLVSAVVKETGLDSVLAGARFDRFFADLYDHFTTADAWAPFPDARPALEWLAVHGVRVGLITNYDTRVYPVLEAVGLAPLLDSVTIPALAGAAKPNAAIFQVALEAQQAEAGRALYVGDEPGDDYMGAQAAGLMPVLIDRDGRYAAGGYRRIVSLMDLATGFRP